MDTGRDAAPVGSLSLLPEEAVQKRYSNGARQVEPALCCAVSYRSDYLAVIPAEILERDYGCGDPTPFLRSGDTVLDLGCGGGKLCYIAAQVVGPQGRVIGVDCNAEMLALARKHQGTVAESLGYANVEFRSGLIQDLRLDLDLLAAELARQPVCDRQGWLDLRTLEERLRRDQPLVADESVDCVVSNCVLNLVRPQDRALLFGEIFRVLRPGGRTAISDIVSDQDVPAHLQQDPELFSGCISGVDREDRFLKRFEEAGFHGLQIVKRQAEPWRTIEGIEFRSLTLLAYKSSSGPVGKEQPTLIYRGPFRKVEDDHGHVFRRGQGLAVDTGTCRLLQQEPYTGLFEVVEQGASIGAKSRQTDEASSSCCGPNGSCS